MPDYAIYGVHFYGTARYGLPPRFDFSLDKFTAVPVAYSRIKVEWGHPSGAWDRIRLVRGNYGFPTDEIDGKILAEGAVDDATHTALGIPIDPLGADDVNVTPGRFHYYSVFLHQTAGGAWVRAGNAICLLPKNYNMADRLYELTPGILRDNDQLYITKGGAGTEAGSGMLQAFLDTIGYQCDLIRSELETLLWTADPQKIAGGLLPALARQLGFPYESELGMELVRRQIANAVYLYKKKGTRPGIEGAISVLSGWAPIIVVNLLTADQSDFEGVVAGWYDATAPANATRARSTAQARSGVASMTLTKITGAGVMSAATGQMSTGMNIVPTTGISVTGGQTYTAYASFRANTTGRLVYVTIYWYDVAGTYISTTTSSSATDNNAGWVDVATTAVAPATAALAAVNLATESVPLGEVHYIDRVGLRPLGGSWASPALAPGEVGAVLLADRVNRILNPSAETNVTTWTAAPGGGTPASVTQDATQFLFGTKSFRLTSPAVAGPTDTSMSTPTALSGIPVQAGVTYTASIYNTKPLGGTQRNVRVDIAWYNAAGGQIGSTVLGAPVLQTLGSWAARPSLTATAPPAARYATMIVNALQLGNAESQYFDGALFEQGAAVGSYFDGAYPGGTDYMWEPAGTGTAHLSRTHYYHRRALVNSRLAVRILDFLPAGYTFTPLWAQPL